jgi:hypothetical protein
MAAEETTSQEGNIKPQFNAAQLGLNMDNTIAQVKKGTLTYALNAALENFDANSVNYQNEQGNELCLGNTETGIPQDYSIIGNHFIAEKNKHIFFLVNSKTGASQIGYMLNNDCVYHTLLSLSCLAFDVNFPIHKVVHKITNCTTEIYWTDGKNPRRFLDIDKATISTDCNLLNIQPNFNIPNLEPKEVLNGGELTAGTYQFAIQYCNAQGAGYTSYYSVTNPLPIANINIETLDFNYPVNRSIRLNITNIDTTGYFEYYNVAVIKTVNNITSVELIGTYYIDKDNNQFTYSGQNQTQIRLTIEEIFEKYPYYDIAEDVTVAQDQLIWDGLTSNARSNFQWIAAQITLKWQTYKIPATENYSNELNALNLRGYLRDEVYAFEIVFLLKNGKQTDGFHIPGRAFITGVDGGTPETTIPNTNPDYIGTGTSAPKWKIYNTAYGVTAATGDPIGSATPYQYGEFAYWQSEENYEGDVFTNAGLTGPIRHHKFPDVLVSPIFESATPIIIDGEYFVQMQNSSAVYPIGVKVDTAQIESSIAQAVSLGKITQQEANNIAGYKIVRGNRNTNKSVIAKGIIRNIGKYTREGTSYYFPNYPYNDLNEDPFLLEKNNAYSSQSVYWTIITTLSGSIQYTDSYTGELTTKTVTVGTSNLCSITEPIGLTATITVSNPVAQYGGVTFTVTSESTTRISYQDPINYPAYTQKDVVSGNPISIISVSSPTWISGNTRYTVIRNESLNPYCYPSNLTAFSTDDSKFRMVFNSPETSFGQPTLGSIFKLESALIGGGKSHFVQVKNNAKYKLLNKSAQKKALDSSYNLANSTGTFNASAMFTTYQSYLTIYINGLSRQNFAYSFNSVATYGYWKNVTNDGNKQRELSLYQYLNSSVQSVGDTYDVNNFQRESSVYLKTKGSTPLPYVKDVPSVTPLSLTDNSRFTISKKAKCGNPEEVVDITTLSYYGSIKNYSPNQWGKLYTYETIDTGFQVDRDSPTGVKTVFGGDTFISRFAFKTKLPFFIDNRVGAPDDSDIEYDQLGNIAYPQYWHSSRSILSNYWAGTTELSNIVSVKANYLDCVAGTPYSTTGTTTTKTPGSVTTGSLDYEYIGKMYMFAYGIPYFYCESSVNTDLRQAYNNGEGNFYPHVSSGIPDDWLQQTRVPIALDNTYYYNVSYSKQNIENYFSHLPLGWDGGVCDQTFPFRAIYSEPQSSSATNKVNNWLLYRPISYFDFPQSYGGLTSLDGIQNRAVLARFENKSLLYNTMLTIDTSNPQAAYMGNSTLFKSAPPIDFAETDLGYVGSQHKFLLKIPQGQITVDAKRGQIFLISGNQATDLTAFGSGVNRFMTDHLAFEILRYFPDADVDNHFNGVGLHGVYDSKFDRVIITKLDYIPQPSYIGVINYGNDSSIPQTYKKYYTGTALNPTIVSVSDLQYFCNKSWTMSFNINTKSWVSFHTYLPNYYIGENNFFYSGLNEGCDMTFVAAVPVPTDCNLPGGSAVKQTTTTTTTSAPGSTTTTTTLPGTTTTTTTVTPSTTTTTTTSSIADCTLNSGTAIKQTTTTTTTTVSGPTSPTGTFYALY